ncbi:MAG: di-trans,poly-cis-decaprenylcistransferase [Candidatus Pacebacteria bacterium]|jgi:undecaprenyl diphosphate synthase|nr:di-trans,poly-cis-decaprenylcistransferase [Candidatus Paceibacterota bacterium]MBT3512148.1 di-trans,poly-cis-decaprenylcistransferase [Candidatus Paceibacterota bacterium]MBT4005390.1 di-trans,poly-cis-decaprenylcistransferase [Candidatus Paceibacterota bacterium]MBT4359099.1 di-trans,poly-cis-decaprenylcistransferase [Candidatus Paceibacterota bacterium]MBT4680984.1 di-trans,poly-cis-decaprenylcistransferase [Candidatus Paceibacterota bacterium]
MNQDNNLPHHIAIVMDGNRRWAKKRGLAIIKGHRQVSEELIEELADHCIQRGIKYLTLWAFSTENWNRDPMEVKLVMDLFREMLEKNIDQLHQKGIKISTIGDLSRFDQDIREKIEQGVMKTVQNKNLTLTFALNYGGKDDLLRAVNKLSKEDKAEITSEMIDQSLDTADLPDPDLVIRPGGEKRLSGFLLWQTEYSELYFSDVLMPDFNAQELDKAIEDYQNRQRRFGK